MSLLERLLAVQQYNCPTVCGFSTFRREFCRNRRCAVERGVNRVGGRAAGSHGSAITLGRAGGHRYRALQKPRIIILSVIDNLIKGQTGQAIQNLNLISGLPINNGLEMINHYP